MKSILIICLFLLLCSCSPITSGVVVKITRVNSVYSGEVIEKHYEPEYYSYFTDYDDDCECFLQKRKYHLPVYKIRLKAIDSIDNLIYENWIDVYEHEYMNIYIGDFKENEFCADYRIDIQGKDKKGKTLHGWIFKNCHDVLSIKIGDYIE